MKTYRLMKSVPCEGDGKTLYYVDGKQCKQSTYDNHQIRARMNGDYFSSFTTQNIDGTRWNHYCAVAY